MSELTRQRSGIGPSEGGAEKGAPGRGKAWQNPGSMVSNPEWGGSRALVGNGMDGRKMGSAGVVKDLMYHHLGDESEPLRSGQ